MYYNCNDVTPTNLNVTNIIHDRVIINWDNMNSSTTIATTHYINSGNYYYTPSSLTINTGDTVIWINDGGYHNVNFDVSSVTANPITIQKVLLLVQQHLYNILCLYYTR